MSNFLFGMLSSISTLISINIYRGLERRIVDVEMELTLAKSEGFLKNQLQQSGSSSGKKLLAVIGVYTGFGGRLRRHTIRGSWMSQGEITYHMKSSLSL